jgi:signal transduction histidine kinase
MDARPISPARRALFIYAGVTAAIGVYLILWGPVWFPVPAGQPAELWVPAAIVRIVGAVLIVFASGGFALTRALDDQALLRGIHWFAIGHGVLWAVFLLEKQSIFGSNLTANLATALALVLFGGLIYVRDAEQSRLGRRGDKASAAMAMHSRYDQAIREAASQEERHRLARELHDSIKQQIFAMQTAAATAEARLEEDHTGVREAISLVRASAREAMTEMEAMLDQLRATPLDNAGLIAALQKQCDALGFRTGAEVSLAVGALPADNEIEPGVRPALLRIAQEALANVARHARAQRVTVMIGSSGRGLDLSISDDGAGFDPNTTPAGMGRRSMESRVADIDGKLTIVSAAGTGTTIHAVVPPSIPRNQIDRWKPWNNNAIVWVGMFLTMLWDSHYGFVFWTAILIGLMSRDIVFRRERRPS